MKRFALAVVVMGSLVLSACGNAEKEKELQGKVDSCMKESTDKGTRITELEAELATLKAAAAPAMTATPATPAATSKPGAKKTPTPAKTAPPATPTPATPTPTVPQNIKLPGKLPG